MLTCGTKFPYTIRIVFASIDEVWRVEMRAFVFPGQGGGVSDPAPEMVPEIQRVVGERIPDQVKIFVRAARDADESRIMKVRPDVVAGHSLGEYGAAYAAGCFDFETGLWLVAQRDHFRAEAAGECPGGRAGIPRAEPGEGGKGPGARRGRPDGDAQNRRAAISERHPLRGSPHPPLRTGPEPPAAQRRRIGYR